MVGVKVVPTNATICVEFIRVLIFLFQEGNAAES